MKKKGEMRSLPPPTPLTRGYGFMGGVYHPPFDTLKKCTSAYDMNLKLYR